MEMELVDSVPETAPAAPATPSPEPTTDATPAPETSPEATPADGSAPEANPATPEPAPQLYKLPDGREVDAAGLQREYENLLPEFTRRSQKLAELETKNKPPITNEEPEWKSPDFSPKSWAEAIEIAKQEALKEFVGQAQAQQQAEAQVREAVDAQINELKVTDPKLDENALFAHAVKWGFTDLKAAHSNFKEMQSIALTTEQRTLKNLQTRAADPVATVPTAPVVSGPKDFEYDPALASNFRNATDYLEYIKKNK